MAAFFLLPLKLSLALTLVPIKRFEILKEFFESGLASPDGIERNKLFELELGSLSLFKPLVGVVSRQLTFSFKLFKFSSRSG